MSGYPYGHWKGCRCEFCDERYRRSNPMLPNVVTCGCAGCQNRWTEEFNTVTKDRIARTIPELQTGTMQMSTINQCEREGCFAFVKGKAVGGVTLVMNNDMHGEGRTERLELCPACVEDLWKVMSTEPLAPREKSYSKPFDPDARETDDQLSAVTDEQLAAALFQRMMAQAKNQIEK